MTKLTDESMFRACPQVDGYFENLESGEKTVLEFNGCWYHGCPQCYKDRTAPIPNSPKETLGTRYEYTTRRKHTLESLGYKVYISLQKQLFNFTNVVSRL